MTTNPELPPTPQAPEESLGLGRRILQAVGIGPRPKFTESGEQIIRIPRKVLKAARNDPVGQELLEYGAKYEEYLVENNLIHP